MTKPSSFSAKLRSSGNSVVVTIPKEVADLWKVGNRVQVTIESLGSTCIRCGNGAFVITTRKGELVCETCLDEEAKIKLGIEEVNQ